MREIVKVIDDVPLPLAYVRVVAPPDKPVSANPFADEPTKPLTARENVTTSCVPAEPIAALENARFGEHGPINHGPRSEPITQAQRAKFIIALCNEGYRRNGFKINAVDANKIIEILEKIRL